jgi:phosphatidylserine/phosphatidylglycerophosphate/cardiolipin synthase-like enzyme
VGAAIAIGNTFLAGSFQAPALKQWYADAGNDARFVRVRECILRSLMVTHAKIVIDRGKEGVLLGSPFDQDYFDTREHRIDDRRRGADPAKGPIHDVSVGVRGPAVAHMEELFNSHWAVAAPDDVQPQPGTAQPIGIAAEGEIVAPVQLVRTLDRMFAEASDGEKGVLEAYLRGIHFAQRFIYIENQYFHYKVIIDALIDALKADRNLVLILLVNVAPDMPLYPGWQQKAIRRIKDELGSAAQGQLGVFTAWSHAVRDGAHQRPRLIDNYLHTKSALIDNRWATVGSANLDGASLEQVEYARALLGGEVRNTESNLVVWEETPATPSPVDALRRRLWSEHLGFADLSDPHLADASGKDLLELWRQRAADKLGQLLADANAVHPAHILAWPEEDFKRDCGKHVATGDYLRKLFEQQQKGAFVKVSNFDLVPKGPPAFGFHY